MTNNKRDFVEKVWWNVFLPLFGLGLVILAFVIYRDGIQPGKVLANAKPAGRVDLANLGFTALSFCITAVGGLTALYQWRKDQNWKRKTASLERVAAFDATPGSRNVMMILGSSDREIPLFDGSDIKQQYVRVTWEDVANALRPQKEYKADREQEDKRNKAEAIRNSFDDFFQRLSFIEMMIKNRLLEDSDIEILMRQWVIRLRSMREWENKTNEHGTKNPDVFLNLKLYVAWHKLQEVQEMFNRFDPPLYNLLVLEKHEKELLVQLLKDPN